MKKILFSFLFIFMNIVLFGQGDNSIASNSGKFALDEREGILYIVYPNLGIAAYNISNPSNPITLGFIGLEGVIDLAVRNSYIYANQYEDLVVIKVDNWQEETYEELAREDNVFPNRVGRIIVDGQIAIRDVEEIEVVNEQRFEATASREDLEEIIIDFGSAPSSSTQGSMSCLALKGDYLYAINDSDLMTFDANITGGDLLDEVSVVQPETSDLETIFLSGNNLFLGSRTGMYIYDINRTNRAKPRYLSKFTHREACDPVFVKGNIAYITTRTASTCSGGSNQLLVVNISNLNDPERITRRVMTNPHGLSVSNQNKLYVCDGQAGLRVMNATVPSSINQIGQVEDMQTYDVICDEERDVVIVSTTRGWNIYNSNDEPSLLSSIPNRR